MVNGGHRNLEEASSLVESLEETSPTQNEVQEEDFCEPTQHEIQSAELLNEKPLLLDSIWTEHIKLPIPTTTEREVKVLFWRQEKKMVLLTMYL